MPRPHRPQIAGGFYHVVARGVAAAPVVMDDVDRAVFVQVLQRTALRHQWRLLAYCLMTTHVHLVVETPDPNLSRGMQALLSVHAQRFNKRWGRFGHLFADRFSARVIEDEAYLREACTYVLENPVRAGISRSPEAWPWSGGIVLRDMSMDPNG